jgi:hypothetical protein
MALTKVSNSMITGAMINVRDYGATGDGTTDDSAAMQAAITAATGNGQSTLYIPTGVYIVKAQLNVSQCSVLGDGVYASIIKAGSGYVGTNLMYVGSLSQNLVYENFQLDGNTGTANVKGLLVEGNVLHCRFSTIKISNCTDIALYIKGGDSGTTRPSVNTFIDLRIIDNISHGLYITEGRGNTFLNCNFEQLGGIGVYVVGNAIDNPSEFLFQACWIEVAVGGGFYLQNAFSFTLLQNTVVSITTGNAFTTLDSYFCTIQQNSTNALTGPTYYSYKFQGGTRHRLVQPQNNITAATINNFLSDYAVLSPNTPSMAYCVPMFTSNTTSIAANLTRYIGIQSGVVDATYNNVRMFAPGTFTVGRLYAESTTLPGPVGLLYSITLQKNGVDTALSVNLSDANTGIASATGEVTFDVGDTLAFKIVTSSGAVTVNANGLHISLQTMMR